MSLKQVTAVLIGAGLRGAGVYAQYALSYPAEFKVVAVADPNRERLLKVCEEHKIPEEMRFNSYDELFSREKLADCAMVCTQDRMHFEPVMKAMEKGYHVLCEKPMSPNQDEIIQMGQAAKKFGRVLSVCHVLRYSPFFKKIKEMLEEEKIGRLITIQHMESVGYFHQAHSFVRGNWRSDKETSPMILQKCCHDMDILIWLTGSRCTKVSSFGKLTYFKEENAPEGATQYCMDGCRHRDTCPYYAPRFYLEHERSLLDGFAGAVSVDTSPEALLGALKKGPYGRCVFRCDNNVVDHQVVNLEFENGVDVSFTMSAFTQKCERIIVLMGSKGQIRGNMETGEIQLLDFTSGAREQVSLHTSNSGHSGSDVSMMKEFVALIAQDGKTASRTGADMSVESHLVALAAEKARITGNIVTLNG